jgi:hypothetical protein
MEPGALRRSNRAHADLIFTRTGSSRRHTRLSECPSPAGAERGQVPFG